MTFWVVSLPSIDTRYTHQWYNMTGQYIAENNRKDIVLLGSPDMYSVKPTDYLNYRDYWAYTYPQLTQIIHRAKDGDTVFFMDGETPGAEVLEYVRAMEGVDIKIRMYWHSGCYDPYDLPAKRGLRGEHFERGWFDIAEKIYVGSPFHKQALIENREVSWGKIEVTGSALDLDKIADGSRTPKVRKFLYTGRKVPEKGYDIVQELRKKGVPIEVSLDNSWNKEEYRKQISQSEMLVVPAKHELFGYAMMEAFAMNVPCMVPDEGMFATMVPAQYRVPFDTFEDPIRFLKAADAILKSAGNERAIAEPYDFRKVMDRWFS